MIKNGTTIVSAANFKTYISKYLKEIDQDQEPVFLTVNGEGTHVIMHVSRYDDLCQYKNLCLHKKGDNGWLDIIQSRKKPLKPEEYEVLKATFKSIWGFYSAAEMDEVEKEIAADEAWLEHQAELINAKRRAFRELTDKPGEIKAEKEVKS